MIYIRFVRSRMIPLSLLIAEFSSFSRRHGIGGYLSETNLSREFNSRVEDKTYYRLATLVRSSNHSDAAG
jgi:hypothetical protein